MNTAKSFAFSRCWQQTNNKASLSIIIIKTATEKEYFIDSVDQ